MRHPTSPRVSVCHSICLELALLKSPRDRISFDYVLPTMRFAKDYPSKDDLELQEKWLQSAENSKQWEYPILFSLIAELARPSLPLSMKLRLSKIFAMQPLTSSSYKLREAIITLLYQLFKDHPWSFLEEELECNKVRLWKTVIYQIGRASCRERV